MHLKNSLETLRSDLNEVSCERDNLQVEVLILRQQLEMAETLAEEKKAIATETAKDAEISHCKTHIIELNLHAEAQAHNYKQKFKALESMAEQVKPEGQSSTHGTNSSSSSKLEKNGTKSRGSGSPFKCTGLGLSQQIKSKKYEELNALRLRIEKLEVVAANQQKKIFMLNARLAAMDSMTHDFLQELSTRHSVKKGS